MTAVPAIAIDFGTARTKVAYRSANGDRVELMRFGGEHDLPYAPSLFYCPKGDAPVLFGAAAERMLDRDPAGIVTALKRRLRDPVVRANGRSAPLRGLLETMYAELRQQAGRRIPAFSGAAPETVVLTVPAACSQSIRELLTAAALAAGFSTVELMDEPVAAARGWLAQARGVGDSVVVLDCGGGTVDWAWVRREGGRLRIEPSCPPGGVEGLGGHDVDVALMDRLEERLAAQGIDSGEFGALRRPRLLARLRRLKEAAARGEELDGIEIAGVVIDVPAAEIEDVVHASFVARAVAEFRAFYEAVRKACEARGGETPPVLLAGAAAGLPGLSDALSGELECRFVGWDRADFGPVLGALAEEEPSARAAASSRPVRPPGTVFRDTDEPWCPEMVVLPRGQFWMGSPEDEPGRFTHEGPRHRVSIDHDLAMGTCAVSFAEWDAYALASGGYRPQDEGWGRGDRPVINVSWEDAQEYLAWLNGRLGLTDRPDRYRLPSEAEWEFACRAGTETPFWWGRTITPSQANYNGNGVCKGGGSKGEFRKKTVPVRSFSANPYGLYQMHGNVWEWCADVWDGDYTGAPADGSARTAGRESALRIQKGLSSVHILRGSSWESDPDSLRSASRGSRPANFRIQRIGLRVARTFSAEDSTSLLSEFN